MHEKRDTVITRQTVDYTIYLFRIVTVIGNVVIGLARLVYMKHIVGMINKYLVTHLLAVVVYEDVPHYGIHPPFEIRTGRIFVHVA